jgi:hypothetical protein
MHDETSFSDMEASGDQATHQQQQEQLAQQRTVLQHSSAQLSALRVPGALLAHFIVSGDHKLLLTLMQASKQLQAEAAAEGAGQLAVTVGLYEQQSPSAQGFAAWLEHHAGLLRELHVELRCLGSDGSAVLQCLQKQEQQLQALQCLELVSHSNWFASNLQDGWADPLLPHLPVGLRRLQLTGSRVIVQEDAVAALSRLQQLTQLTIGWPYTSTATVKLQHMPAGLQSLDLTCSREWGFLGQHALAPLSRLQQLTELRLGQVQSEQLGQLPPALQQLDLTLLANKQGHRKAASWYQLHAHIVRRLVLDGGMTYLNLRFLDSHLQDGWAVVLAAFPAAFDAAAAAAAAALGAGNTQLPAYGETRTAAQAPALQ